MLKNPSAEGSSDSVDDSCSKMIRMDVAVVVIQKIMHHHGGDSADAAEKSEEAPVDV